MVVADGYVLTVAHVVRGASTVTVDGAPGVVVAVDHRIDAALIAVATHGPAAVATMASSSRSGQATIDGRPVVVERPRRRLDRRAEPTTRRTDDSALVLDGQVTHGDSGSGVFGPDGAIARDGLRRVDGATASVAYAVATSELRPVHRAARRFHRRRRPRVVLVIELAVCAEMVFLDLPFVERVRRIHELGFAVEMWGWTGKDIAALAATGARFSSMTGYVHGNLVEADAAATMLNTAAAAPSASPHRSGAPASSCTRPSSSTASPPRPMFRRHPGHVAHRPAHPRPTGRPGRARRGDVLPGEPQRRGRPSRRAVRQGRRHAGARRSRRPARACG